MKIQCSCGAKYVIDITPGMQPIQFICARCGQNYSNFVNDLIRKELAQEVPVTVPVTLQPTPAPVQVFAPVPASQPPALVNNFVPPVPTESRLKISRQHAPIAVAPEEPSATGPKQCPKHREAVTEQCAVCKKPICPKCMEMFGYFCSVFCKGKAEAQKMDVPVYAGQTFAVESRFWRKVGLISGTIVAVVVAFVGLWIWYAWFGSVPHPYFSVRFDQMSYSGSSRLVGKDQIIFLHGSALARYDLKTKKEIWSHDLVTKQMVDDEVKREEDERTAEYKKYGEAGADIPHDRRQKMARRRFESELSLHGSGQNVWLSQHDKLVRYDWDSGKVTQEISLTNTFGEFIEDADEFLIFQHTAVGAQFVTHINIANGESRTEEFHEQDGVTFAQNSAPVATPKSGGGLTSGGAEPLDPQRIAQEAQNLTPAAKVALPALIASAQHNQQIETELHADDPKKPKKIPATQRQRSLEYFELIPSKNGYVQFASRMLEEHFVERNAMKAPPKKSALNGPNVGMANEAQIVNEQLNEIQRTSGGDKVSENLSRYRATIRRPDAPDLDWTGEVIGSPQLFPLKTVNVLAAGKTIIVFDKSNKKLWQAELTYAVSGSGGYGLSKSAYGEGPCAEHGDTLYVFDEAVLTAYDLSSGNARWRFPTVGVVGLFFDNQGMVYVNTTTGSPDDIKYSRQIDVNKKTDAILLKIDPKTGKTLWSVKPGGYISYLSGKFIYTIQTFDPGDDEGGIDIGIKLPPYLRIARINPKNGRVMWEHFQERAPLDVEFAANSIQIIFKKEVQVLRFFTF